ncbi:membrane-associated guanylate kinase, WW and PDZ domain-containing protein 2 [Ochlerotatus camptorhynchus]|uniref:membrane-associated guanylate kinase, WW and PDZ domain-containing protein 2 n=1 Tax=Ochlerotatus camptorhynchus TaxID=644619 RepID=UPI0031D2A477
MRLGGAPGGGDPLAMGAGNDYAELCDLGPSRWSSRSGYQQVSPPVNSIYHHTGGSIAGVGGGGGGGGGPSGPGGTVVGGGGTTLSSSGGATIRSNSFEAEDVIGPYGTSSSRIGNSTSSLRGRSGLYYSPPGTSYTIVERERPHSPHYYYNTAGVPSKGGSLPSRSSYLESASLGVSTGAGTVPNSTRHNGKKRPISPEQVIRLFNTQSSSSSVPTSYHSNGTRDRGRRSPASSPPSTTHQIYRDRDRDRSIPIIHNLSTRTVNMSRDQQTDASHGFGICVKGGKDSGVGVYISRIEQDSLAERAGLRPGDTILEVNGTPFMAINHEEALKRCVQILKSSRQISMTVRAPPSAGTSMINSTAPLHGFGPPPSVVGSTSRLAAAVADPLGSAGLVGGPTGGGSGGAGGASVGAYPPPPNRQTCSWMDRQGRPASPPYEYGGRRPERRDRVRRVELVIEPGQSLGLMIRGGVEYGLGIFITGVDKDSVADRAGLMVGDQILEVNNQSFMDVTHDEAVSQFKFHKRMSLLVRDVGKVPHSCTTVEPEPWDAYSPTGVRTRRKCPVSAMVEEKARSLLPRHHFANLSYYIAEYGARGMTIEAFVSVLLEMLDTPEKHTLVTEIRELIFPEDRTRYDELVYRRGRDVYGDPLDRHRRKDLLPHSHDLPVSDTDLEVIEATGRGLADDPGAVAAGASNSAAAAGTTPDIRNRPPAPLPYRPMSAGPILHHHPPTSSSSSRHLNTSQSHLADLGSGGTPNRVAFGGLGAASPPAGVLGLNPLYHPNRHKISSSSSDVVKQLKNKDYNDPSRPRRGSETQLSRADYDSSMQRLPMDQNGSSLEQSQDQPPHIVPDHRGNLHITVKKSKPILGIAIEGGANTKHPLPRIINIHEHGAAYDAGGLEVGQLILEVDGNKVDGMHHQDVARLIAECFAARDKNDITFLVVEAKKSNLEPKPTALIFLEA